MSGEAPTSLIFGNEAPPPWYDTWDGWRRTFFASVVLILGFVAHKILFPRFEQRAYDFSLKLRQPIFKVRLGKKFRRDVRSGYYMHVLGAAIEVRLAWILLHRLVPLFFLSTPQC